MTAIHAETHLGDKVAIGPVPKDWRAKHPEAQSSTHQVTFNSRACITGSQRQCVRVFKLLTEPHTIARRVTADWPQPDWVTQ